MKRIYSRIISAVLVTVLAALSLAGCTIIDDISNGFVDSIYGNAFDDDTTKPETDDFSIEDAINAVTTSHMSSFVTVTTDHFNRGSLGMMTGSATVLGSGSVIMVSTNTSGTNLYVLTNDHCVKSLPEFQYKNITMTDYRGNEYTGGQVLTGSQSEAYDLAVVVFSCTSTDLQPITIAKQNPETYDTVIAIGSSLAQRNSITIGKATAYYQSELIEVEALYHTAPLGSGGSGGALLNTDLELCGVNFAADVSEKEYGNGSSIPIGSVREHLATLEIFSEILD